MSGKPLLRIVAQKSPLIFDAGGRMTLECDRVLRINPRGLDGHDDGVANTFGRRL
jgi:hypothetical protein